MSSPISTRLDAPQDDQVPAISFDMTSYPPYPTMYPIPGSGLSSPPLAPLLNATIPVPCPVSSGASGHGAGPSYVVPNYQGQGTVYPPANTISSMFPITNVNLQQSFYPPGQVTLDDVVYGSVCGQNTGHHEQLAPSMFECSLPIQPQVEGQLTLDDVVYGSIYGQNTGRHEQLAPGMSECSLPIQPGVESQVTLDDAVYASIYGQNIGHHEQLAPSMFEWSIPMQPEIVSQFEAQVIQDISAQQFASVYGQDYQTNGGVICVLEMQRENQPASHPEKERMNANGDKEYFCDECRVWVLERRRKHHNKKHDPNVGSYICKICEALGWVCQPLSRKDALKRHVDVKHHKYVELLKDASLGLLEPRRSGVRENLSGLKRAMISLLARKQSKQAKARA